MQLVITVFLIDTSCIQQLMNVILSKVNFCNELNRNTLPSPSQQTVAFFIEDPVIVMLLTLKMSQGGPEDMRCSPSSKTTVVLDLSGPLHR